MPVIAIADKQYDVDAVIFDKDGTLIDFAEVWGPRAALWARELTAMVDSPPLEQTLCRAIGYDPHTALIAPDSPLAVASLADLYAIAASTLFQHGIPWHEGYPLVSRVAARTLNLPISHTEVKPRGPVFDTLQALHQAGIALGIATNDDRAITEAAVEQLGITHLISAMVCGNDPFLPKPDPGGLRWLATQLDTATERMAIVGDTGVDMLAGRNAGLSACIGLSGGAGSPATLARTADLVIDDLSAIRIPGA